MTTLITPTEPFISYRSGFKYQTNQEFSFLIPSLAEYAGAKTKYLEIREGGLLVIFSGYAWDGASGPTFDTDSSMRGSLVHDALYQLMRYGLIPEEYKETADEIIEELCVEDGMWEWRAGLWLNGLMIFGGKNVKPSKRKKIRYAP